MSKIFRLFLIVVLAAMALPAASASAAPILTDKAICENSLGIYGSTPDGSNFCLWLPALPYQGDLIIFAHGYVDPLTPDGAIPWDQLALTTPSLPQVVAGQLKTAFAVTSYSHNGLAVTEGVAAVRLLANILKNPPVVTPLTPIFNHIYLAGASEGGLVTAKAIEDNQAGLFTGGLTTCGPVGDFKAQVNYWGDFRVAFDYFFQGLRSQFSSPVWISPATRAGWGALDPNQPPSPLQAQVLGALAANPAAAAKLISVGKAPIDPADPAGTLPLTVLGLLDYNVRATNQARMELSANFSLDGSTNAGNPYGNKGRYLWGSGSFISDLTMNNWLKNNDQFSADPAALTAIQFGGYQTTGRIQAPLVAMHTTGDPIVPFWHELLYQAKIWSQGKGAGFFSIPIARYGHCAFTTQEVVFAYAVLVFKATGMPPVLPLGPAGDPAVLTSQDFSSLMEQYAAQQEPHSLFIPVQR